MISFVNKRTWPGFTIKEGLVYLVFCLLWPVALGTVYHIGKAFNSETFITLHGFIAVNLVSLSIKILLIIPVWWLYFRKLKSQPLRVKIFLHLLTGVCFGAAVVGLCNICYDFILPGSTYPKSAKLSDFYTYTVYYFFHVSLFHGYNFYLDQQRYVLQQQQLQALAYQSEIKALKSQIEPHFLFNTLNSISASIPYSMEKTRVLIAQLADTFRHALSVSERDFIPLDEEIHFLSTWLQLEKRRLGNRLHFTFDIDENCKQTPFPPMILQPIVENALHHGINPKIDGGEVSVICRNIDGYACISIADTGVGFSGTHEALFQSGMGLSNISKRLQLLYNERLKVEDNYPGLKFSFKIPLNQNNKHGKKTYDH